MPRMVLGIIFFAVALGIAFFFAAPEWRRFQALGAELADLEDAGKELDDLIARRETMLNLVSSISKERLDRLDVMLPRGAHASDFLVSLEALTAAHAISLRRIDLVSPESASKAESGKPSAARSPRPAAASAPAGQAGAGETGKTAEPAGHRFELPFSLQITGSYENFKKFLAAAEKNVRLIDVDEISFSTNGKDSAIDFTLKAKTYYQ